jgi:hypothetical protein
MHGVNTQTSILKKVALNSTDDKMTHQFNIPCTPPTIYGITMEQEQSYKTTMKVYSPHHK